MLKIFFPVSLFFSLILNLMVPSMPYAADQQDIIARVGNQTISLREIDTMINSSTLIGLYIPAPGTPERNAARLSLLDKAITADLLYLDALKAGLDKNPEFQKKVKTYEDDVLASLYNQKVLKGDLPVTEAEVRDYYKKNIAAGTELTDDVKLSIEAAIRKKKAKASAQGMRERVRQGITVVVVSKELEPGGDSSRKASAIVAKVNNEEIHWAEVKVFVTSGAGKDTLKQRSKALDGLIDERIMAAKARENGFEKDPLYQTRVNEFTKTSLINLHRGNILKGFSPQDSEVTAYYNKNRDKIIAPESRKVQMVVLKTRKQAEDIKKKVKSKKMTFFEAARDFSIDPNARQNLGEIGWVKQGTGFPELDKLTFSLKKDKLGGPVESPAGWHLVKVVDIRDALYTNIKDKNTWDNTRRMLLHEKLDQYTADLRKEKFPVTVYEDVFKQLLEKEAKTKQEEAARVKNKELPAEKEKGK